MVVNTHKEMKEIFTSWDRESQQLNILTASSPAFVALPILYISTHIHYKLYIDLGQGYEAARIFDAFVHENASIDSRTYIYVCIYNGFLYACMYGCKYVCIYVCMYSTPTTTTYQWRRWRLGFLEASGRWTGANPPRSSLNSSQGLLSLIGYVELR